MRFFRVQSAALDPTAFERLRSDLLASVFVASTTLNGPFEASRGFGITFTEAGRAEVLERFPALEPWLSKCLGAPALRALTPWWQRTSRTVPNAWYLNVLVLGPGAEVTKHVDGTLMNPAGVDRHPPECVSVLYLRVPASRGGELQLWNGSEPVAVVAPRERSAVHFRGDLSHAVRAFDGDASARRASLVIEQYAFAPEPLARLPAFKLDSRAGFGAFLDDAATRPTRSFELER